MPFSNLLRLYLRCKRRHIAFPVQLREGGLLPISWSPTYSAYIPGSHISGPPLYPCFNITFGPIQKIYKADGQADIGDGWPVQSARTYGFYFFRGSFNNGAFSFPAYQSSSITSVGQTRNYGYGSPLNSSTLSQLDEDGVGNDCLLWNESAYADKSDMHGDLTVNGPTSQSGIAHFYGTGVQPLGGFHRQDQLGYARDNGWKQSSQRKSYHRELQSQLFSGSYCKGARLHSLFLGTAAGRPGLRCRMPGISAG